MPSILDQTNLILCTENICISKIKYSPDDNYRWGSEECMLADLKRETNDGGATTADFQLLVDSIKATGNVLNPIGVVPHGAEYKVVYGFNRYLAAKEAELKSIRATVYRADLDAGLIQSLQAVENADSLRRSVCWVQECRMWAKLLKHAEFEVDQMPERDRPRNSNGRMLRTQSAAWRIVAARLGRSELTMKERLAQMQRIDPDVLEIAVSQSWTYALTKEFYSGDAEHPYPKEFVNAVLKELRRSDAELSRVTPAAVIRAKQRVKKWMADGTADGKTPWRKAANVSVDDAALKRVTLGSKLSPPSLRDAAVNMMLSAILTRKLTTKSNAGQWEEIRKTQAAYRVAGMGIGAGDVLLADGADDMRYAQDFSDTDSRCHHYVTTATVAAGIRNTMTMTHGIMWPVWYESETVFGSTKRSNRFTFWTAVDNAVREKTGIREAIDHAMEYLTEAGYIRG